ncbi:hypothetical protein EDB83DRAFT_2320138 [Lactarius deliciosus]|nr:hypothetical protein EDB83DRAFT_2320138 [Lactarius deliciosus]
MVLGLQILRISNKPTAATITYGFDKATQRVSDYRCHIAFRSSALAASLQQLPKPTITYGFDKAAHHHLARLTQFNFFVPMALKIEWNGLYSTKKTQRPFVVWRIRAHFFRMKLWEQNVMSTSIRPTGWHGEGGLERWGHLTVDFHEENGVHVTTHHVYPTEGAYRFAAMIAGRTYSRWRSAPAAASPAASKLHKRRKKAKYYSMSLCKSISAQKLRYNLQHTNPQERINHYRMLRPRHWVGDEPRLSAHHSNEYEYTRVREYTSTRVLVEFKRVRDRKSRRIRLKHRGERKRGLKRNGKSNKGREAKTMVLHKKSSLPYKKEFHRTVQSSDQLGNTRLFLMAQTPDYNKSCTSGIKVDGQVHMSTSFHFQMLLTSCTTVLAICIVSMPLSRCHQPIASVLIHSTIITVIPAITPPLVLGGGWSLCSSKLCQQTLRHVIVCHWQCMWLEFVRDSNSMFCPKHNDDGPPNDSYNTVGHSSNNGKVAMTVQPQWQLWQGQLK